MASRKISQLSNGAPAQNIDEIVVARTGANYRLTIKDLRTQAINDQTGTAYTLVAADQNALVTLTNGSAITLTVPTNAAQPFPVGAAVDLVQMGAGQVTVAGDTGVTVNGTPGLKLRTQYSGATLIKLDANQWVLLGDLTA